MKKVLLLFVMICLFIPIFSLGALIDNITSYYNFNEQTGLIIDSLNINNGSNYGATNTSGKNYSAYSYINNDYINMSSNPTYRSTATNQNLTISLWVYINSLDNYRTIIAYRSGSTNGMYLYYDTINKMQFQLTDGVNTCNAIGWTPNISQWYNVVLILNANTKQIEIYANTTKVSNATCTNIPNWGLNAGLFTFGRLGDYNGYYFDGKIDEVGIWKNIVLNSTYINELYNNGTGSFYPFTIPISINTLFYPNLINQTINTFNGSIIINSTESIYLSINDSRFELNSTSPNTLHHFKNNVSLTDVNYSIFINASNGNNISFWFLRDTTIPTITGLTINDSDILYIGNYSLNFTANDNYALWEINTYINCDGTIFSENISEISINNSITEYNYSQDLEFTDVADCNYNYTLYDAHTDYDITNELNEMIEIPYNSDTEKGLLTSLSDTDYLIKYPQDLLVTSIKTIDSLNYEFINYNKNSLTYYSLESATPIKYLKNSKFNCHFIINNLWHDCEGLNLKNVTKISDNKYIIYFLLPQNTLAIEKSTGILNSNTYTGDFEIIDYPISVSTNISINITINVDSSIEINNTNNNNYTINVNISNPSNSFYSDTTIQNVYLTFIFLFVIYVLMIFVSIKLGTKIGLLITFICGIFLGGYFVSVINGIYASVGILFIFINAYYFLYTILTKK